MSVETASGDRTGASDRLSLTLNMNSEEAPAGNHVGLQLGGREPLWLSREPAFSHQALLYDDADEFLAGTVPFVCEGLRREEAVLVAVTRPRRRALEGELGAEADLVQFVEMESLGANPGRIIPAWRRFVARHVAHDRPGRGIGEPVWPGRGPAELAECRRHEMLLNLAFAHSPAWQLLCPYDARGLDEDTLEGACHTHPHFACGHGLLPSADYLGPGEAPDPLTGELPELGTPAVVETSFDAGRLATVRAIVASQAAEAGLRPPRSGDLVLAVDEMASNSVCHGGGMGRLRIWREPDRLVCEVRDFGRVADPLVGRREPLPRQPGGRGLWIVNQVCDLVQLRSGPPTVVRVQMSV